MRRWQQVQPRRHRFQRVSPEPSRPARLPDRGFGLGDTATAIKAAYGPLAYVSPHKYAAAPAEYITTWNVGGSAGYVQNPAARGIAYHIGTDGTAEHVAAGGPSIQYVEGCA